MHSLAASYLGTPQSTSATNPHSLSPSLNGTENCLLRCPPVSHPAFNLFRYRPSYQIGIKLRLLDLPDGESHLLSDKILKVEPHFINSLPPSTNDNTRPGSVNGY